MSTTYDQWKATDEAGDDADVRDSAREMSDVMHHDPLAEPAMVRCRACGAEFENPYGGGAEAALCDGCLAKPPDDAAIDRVRRMP